MCNIENMYVALSQHYLYEQIDSNVRYEIRQ